MPQLDLNDVVGYVESNIGSFHEARLKSLAGLKLQDVLKKKNPYLFRAKNVQTGHDLIKTLLDAHLSSQEEGIFGEFLEGLAVFVCGKVFGGRKSAAEGIDLEFQKDRITYLVVIKSGPNWGNSGQIRDMKETFKKAKRILQTNNRSANVVAVNGCCYGRDNQPDKGDYLKLCGQRFWEFISNNENLYIEIIEPLGHRAKERNEEFAKLYANSINIFDREILNNFCKQNGTIDWKKLAEFNSGKETLPTKRTRKSKD